MEERTNVFQTIGGGFSAASAQLAQVDPAQSLLMEAMGSIYTRAADAARNGDPIAWCSFGVPSEILQAMDIAPIVDVVLGVVRMIPGSIEKYIDLAEEFVPEYVCSTNKLPLGLLLSGDIPLPSFLIAQNNPCDSILGLDSAVGKHLGIPYFGIGTAYTKSEEGYRYTASELKRLVIWLEEQTGRKMDYARLQQAMEHSNRAHELVLKINDLVAQSPCRFALPASGMLYPLLLHLPGTPELVNCLEKLHQSIQYKVDNNIPPAFEEKVRLVWIYAMGGFDNANIFDWVAREYGAISITYMNNNITVTPTQDISDYDSIMLGLAKKSRNMPMSKEGAGPWEDWADNSIEMVRHYKADGAVFGGHVACKSNWAAAKLVKDKLLEETGVPTLILEMDFVDHRVASGEAIRDQLIDFVELILSKREHQGEA